MNIFEGGRRIAKVVGALFVVPMVLGGIVKMFDGEPSRGGELIGWALGSFAVYWVLVAAVGWIVRGFLGIPKGQDYRIDRVGP